MFEINRHGYGVGWRARIRRGRRFRRIVRRRLTEVPAHSRRRLLRRNHRGGRRCCAGPHRRARAGQQPAPDICRHRPIECWTFGSEDDRGFWRNIESAMRLVGRGACIDTLFLFSRRKHAASNKRQGRGRAGYRCVGWRGIGGGAIPKRRGATVIAQSSANNASELHELGADRVPDRNENVVSALGENSVDVMVDVVVGE